MIKFQCGSDSVVPTKSTDEMEDEKETDSECNEVDDTKNEEKSSTDSSDTTNRTAQRALKCMELMIVHCKHPNDAKNQKRISSQRVFLKEVIGLYRDCRSTMKYEFPPFIISIFYHIFGDRTKSAENTGSKVVSKVMIECLAEIREIIIGSLASRMYPQHRLDIFKLIQMAVVLRGHRWFEGQCKGMDSEKLFLFVLSSLSNEIQINLEAKKAKSKETATWKARRFSAVDTNLNVLDKLVSYIISEDEAIDSWIGTFAAQTMHALQQHIHQAIGALFFFVTELKMAVFEQHNDDGLKRMERAKTNANSDGNPDANSDDHSEDKMSKILDGNTLQLLDRVLYGITMYLNNDQVTFGDEFCSILPFVLCQFGAKYLGVISNVISKMLTQQSAESKEEDRKLKDMIIEQMYFRDYLFDIVIAECLHPMAMKLGGGYDADFAELFELENEFVSVSLMVHDVFAMNESKFVKKLLSEKETKSKSSKLEMLIQMICRISIRKETQELVLPLLMVVIRTINRTADKKLDQFVQNGIKEHKDNLLRIGSACQQQEHAWHDDLALGLEQLSA